MVVFSVRREGPISDIIYLNVKISQELGLRDVAEGLTDISMEGVSGPTLMNGSGNSGQNGYLLRSALTYGLFVNPYPNKAPYVKVNGKDFFNVMAINEFRYALNGLISLGSISLTRSSEESRWPKALYGDTWSRWHATTFKACSLQRSFIFSGSMLYPAYSLQRLFPRRRRHCDLA